MGASDCRGKPPNALRAKGIEKEEEIKITFTKKLRQIKFGEFVL
jgi:hypothetical protein